MSVKILYLRHFSIIEIIRAREGLKLNTKFILLKVNYWSFAEFLWAHVSLCVCVGVCVGVRKRESEKVRERCNHLIEHA